MSRIAVIITTYNTWAELGRCLAAYLRQSRMPDLVTIADDGSRPPPEGFFERFSGFPELRHVWQSDTGHLRARILNLATHFSDVEKLIFTDADCLPHRHFVRDHDDLLEDGFYVQGTRAEVQAPARETFSPCLIHVLRAMVSGGMIARIKALRLPRMLRRFVWGGPLYPCGCNISCWRRDFIAVNGYDEAFDGWGWEDNDFVRRLRTIGIACRQALGCCVLFHLDHPASRGVSPNQALMERRRTEGAARAPVGYEGTAERGEVRCTVYRSEMTE